MTLKTIVTLLSVLFFVGGLHAQTEICDNAVDDDGDGLVDLNDDDCTCELIEPISYIPNPSFEETDCCPNNRGQLGCATGWIQASEATTDFINTCDYLGWPEFPPPLPFPDGQGIMGFRDGRITRDGSAAPNWKEYAGACLLQPLLRDSFYRFEFDVGFVNAQSSPPIAVTFFGTADCGNLPFGLGNEGFGCPSNDTAWVKLGEVQVSGNGRNVWVNTFIDILPDEDIYAIAIGPPCESSITSTSLYYYFDNLNLAELSSFTLQISDTDQPCSEVYALSMPNNPSFSYQWYRDGIALVGETSSDLSQLYGEGSYQVMITNSGSCRVTQAFEYSIPQEQSSVSNTICFGDFFAFGGTNLSEPGVYFDTLKTQDNCDSIIRMELTVAQEKYDTVVTSILAGEIFSVGNQVFTQEGRYSVPLQSSIGCDSLVFLDLTTFNFFIPTAFSPNGDAVNDIFRPFAEDDRVVSLNLKVFDRWGGFLTQGTSWDGSDADAGVYVYLIDVLFSDGTEKVISGDVSLIK